MRKLAKSGLAEFLQGLSSEYDIAVPVMNEKGQVEFKITEDFSGICLERNSINSIKEFFFPQKESLFTIKDGEITSGIGAGSTKRVERKTLVFGARPCDIRAVEILDKVFLDERFVDPYYRERRDRTVIIGYSCPKSEPGCFCMNLGIDPTDSEGVDIVMFEDEKNYWFRIREACGKSGDNSTEESSAEETSAGKSAGEEASASGVVEALGRLEDSQPAPNDPDAPKNLENLKAVHKQKHFFDLKFPLDEKKLFNEPFWDEIFRKCIGCGTCTYLCPTCHCFEMYNRKDAEGSSRVRCWDSCQYSLFTEHASGHNPRNTQKERTRQRVMHKFSYYPVNYGVVSCVGCGRCIRKCPVTLDIREVLGIIEGRSE